MRTSQGRRWDRSRRGLTLAELLVAMGVLSVLGSGVFMVYASVTNLHRQKIWRLAPYDEATRAADRLADELQEAMLILDHQAEWIVVVMPVKDENGDYVLTEGEDGYVLDQGERVAFYLSDETGAVDAQGDVLWKATAVPGESVFTPLIKIAENIHPELSPTDPETGAPRPMFKYWPDEVRLDGVEIWVTATAEVQGEMKTQVAHTETYLRNK